MLNFTLVFKRTSGVRLTETSNGTSRVREKRGRFYFMVKLDAGINSTVPIIFSVLPSDDHVPLPFKKKAAR